MSGDIKLALFGWGLIIAFLVIRYFYKKNQEKKYRSYASNLVSLAKASVDAQKKLNDKPQILYFKSNRGAFNFALKSLMNGFGTMNFYHAGMIKGKAFDKKKEVQKKIKGDVETVTKEITKFFRELAEHHV